MNIKSCEKDRPALPVKNSSMNIYLADIRTCLPALPDSKYRIIKTLDGLVERLYQVNHELECIKAEQEEIENLIKTHPDMPPKMEECGDYIVKRNWRSTVKLPLERAKELGLTKIETKEKIDTEAVKSAVKLNLLDKEEAYNVSERITVELKSNDL